MACRHCQCVSGALLIVTSLTRSVSAHPLSVFQKFYGVPPLSIRIRCFADDHFPDPLGFVLAVFRHPKVLRRAATVNAYPVLC